VKATRRNADSRRAKKKKRIDPKTEPKKLPFNLDRGEKERAWSGGKGGGNSEMNARKKNPSRRGEKKWGGRGDYAAYKKGGFGGGAVEQKFPGRD